VRVAAVRASVTREAIDPAALLAGSTAPSDGAALLFLGVVRNRNEGREVGHLEYDAYAEMAERTLREIGREAAERWATGDIHVVHRIGRLEIGEVSVAILVAAPHRGDVYAASRHVIEELKKRVPIWKREGYVDGESEWLRGVAPAASSDGESDG
jgi:molybdopterin synthase catalytic subunit